MSGPVNCTTYSSQCSNSLIQDLCVRLKPPDFPVWIHDSDKQQLVEKCSSWKTYTALCLGVTDSTTAGFSEEFFTDVTTDDYTANVTEIDVSTTLSPLQDVPTLPSLSSTVSVSSLSTDLTTEVEKRVADISNTSINNVTQSSYIGNVTKTFVNLNRSLIPEAVNEDGAIKSGKNWIIPGVTFFLATLIIIGSVLWYKWYRKNSWKYCTNNQIYIDYNYLHNKTNKKAKWKCAKTTKIPDVEKSVMYNPSINKIFISENHNIGEKPVFDDFSFGNTKIVDLQTQSFGEDPLYVLPNAFQDMNVSKENYSDLCLTEELDKEFSLPPLSLSTAGFKGTLETGFVNPAYEGTETIIETALPRKKKKRRFPFLKILKKSK